MNILGLELAMVLWHLVQPTLYHSTRYHTTKPSERKAQRQEASFLPPITPLLVVFVIVRKLLLSLSMKCWISAFNAQGSRVIIVVVQVGAVKIYVAEVEALRKTRKTGWNSGTIKIDVLSGYWCCLFSDITKISNV